MPYLTLLKQAVDQIPHAIGAILVDWEGEAVQEFCHCEQYDMRVTAAHLGIILSRLKNIEQQGELEHVAITSSQRHLIIGRINGEYALAMSIGRACPVELALHHFRGAVKELVKEI